MSAAWNVLLKGTILVIESSSVLSTGNSYLVQSVAGNNLTQPSLLWSFKELLNAGTSLQWRLLGSSLQDDSRKHSLNWDSDRIFASFYCFFFLISFKTLPTSTESNTELLLWSVFKEMVQHRHLSMALVCSSGSIIFTVY